MVYEETKPDTKTFFGPNDIKQIAFDKICDQ